MTIKSYRDLEVWQKAMDLVVICYEITKEFPKSEIYGLTSQLQRAAVSIKMTLRTTGVSPWVKASQLKAGKRARI